MKFLGLNSFLILLAVLFGYVGGSFLTSPRFAIQSKAVMVIVMLAFAFTCSLVQVYWDDLEVEGSKKKHGY